MDVEHTVNTSSYSPQPMGAQVATSCEEVTHLSLKKHGRVFSCTAAASLVRCQPISKDHFIPLNYQPETETHTSAPTVTLTPVHENT